MLKKEMEKKSFKCVICERTLEYSESTGAPPITMNLTLKYYSISNSTHFINEEFKVCISCYNQSVLHVNKNILEHAKNLIENEI